jgi:hypothetical protein
MLGGLPEMAADGSAASSSTSELLLLGGGTASAGMPVGSVQFFSRAQWPVMSSFRKKMHLNR